MLSADVAFMDVACEPIQSGCFEYILVLHYGRFIHVHCVVPLSKIPNNLVKATIAI